MAAQNPLGLQLPQAPPVVPVPPGRVLLANLVPGNFYTVINRRGPGILRETFTGSFLLSLVATNGTPFARFDHLTILGQPPEPPAIWRSVNDNDWYYVPLPPPAAASPASGGLRRKKRKTSSSTRKVSKRKAKKLRK